MQDKSDVGLGQLPGPNIDDISLNSEPSSKSAEVDVLHRGGIHPDFYYNKHNESIFDDARFFPGLQTAVGSNDDVVKFDDNNPDLINNATLKALIVQLTSPEVIDYNLICDFFLTYRVFVKSEQVMNLLLTRLVWSLQYINSHIEANTKIGKLVLLRTFVVLRHWILNYFVDDFDPDSQLCDVFVSTINKLTTQSNLISTQTSPHDNEASHMIFEKKILSDLKIHWLKLITEIWKVNIDIDTIIDSGNALTYILPLTTEIANFRKLSKSNTEMSIHTNPSYRRSAMLSLYDKRALHKCIIFDGVNTEDENPQYSINKLLLQHLSSRQSLNLQLQELQKQQAKSPVFNTYQFLTSNSNLAIPKVKPTRKQTKPSTQNNRHNHMNLKDTSLGLRKTVNSGDSIDDDEIIKNDSDHSPTSVTTNANRIDGSGFSTNGNIKLPTSKVLSIVPPTPVKKMDILVKREREESASINGSPTRRYQPPGMHFEDSGAFGRKRSLKKFVDGWKKSIIHAATPVSHKHHGNDDITLTAIGDQEETNSSITHALHTMSDMQPTIGQRVDVLSARIVDELEYLIRYYIRTDGSPETIIEDDNQFIFNSPNENQSTPSKPRSRRASEKDHFKSHNVDIMGSPAKKQRITSYPTAESTEVEIDNILNDEEDEDEMDINDLSELNIKKIDHLINEDEEDVEEDGERDGEAKSDQEIILPEGLVGSHESSFQRPTSINWNEEADLENSEIPEPNVESDIEDPISDNKRILKACTQYFDVSSELQPEPQYTPLNRSSNSVESSISTPSNLTQYDAEVAELGIALSPQLVKNNNQGQLKRISFSDNVLKRVSVISKNSGSSLLRRDSAKSYMSYDSAFSISNGSGGSFRIDENENGLRKKNGYNNLRTFAGSSKESSNESKSLDLPVRIHSNSAGSYISRSSSVRRSVRFSTLCALTELPFSNFNSENLEKKHATFYRASKLSDVADSSIFSFAIKSRKNSIKKETFYSNSSSANSVAIPGISSFVLKELAAIPDESFQLTDPIEFALFKLEGKQSDKMLRAQEDKEQEQTPDVEMEDTQDILNEINNAHTEDVVDYSMDVSEESPLTPVRKLMRSTVPNAMTSTPNNDSLFLRSNINSKNVSPDIRSPKIILDNYTPSSHLLSVAQVMTENSHISFVLSFDSKSLADHFTVIEKDMLQEVDWKELIELKWNKELTPVNSWLEIIVNDDYYNKNKGVNLVISRFNLMVNWIISEILLSKSQHERICIISRFIHVAQNCYSLQNYSTLMQVILALTSEKVQKLRETWKNLSPGDILMLKNLEELSSPLKNFLNIRLCINQMKPSKGCIPFVGLYLSDLIFNAERPTFIKKCLTKVPSSRSAPGNENETDLTTSTINTQNEEEKVINFSKFRTSVHIVKSLSQCIEWSSYYEIKVNPELLSKCLYVKSLDEDEMNYCLENVDDC